MTISPTRLIVAIAIACVWHRQDATATDPPLPPETRGAMLRTLEALKSRASRLPMPADRIAALQASSDRPLVNNALARRLHLPESVTSLVMGSIRDPAMTLPDALAVELFWVTSRSNDCHYCLGHQEFKLERLGVDEARRLALDTDWGGFPDDERAALTFARKLTLEPHRITDTDVGSLITHFGPLRALEVVWLVSRYHATNCWTHSVGIPQEADKSFVTTLPADMLNRPSIVARTSSRPRPAAPTPDAWQARMRDESRRGSRLPLVGPPEAPAHERLLANFSVAGRSLIDQLAALDAHGTLSARLRWAIFWMASRADQAWYMQHLSHAKLRDLGMDDAEIFGLDDPRQSGGIHDDLAFARRIVVDPRTVDDEVFASALARRPPSEVAELVFTAAMAAQFDRLTESAGLGWSTPPSSGTSEREP